VFKYKVKNLGAFLYGPQEHICLVAMTLGFTQFKESIGGVGGGGGFIPKTFLHEDLSFT
jgi:hypothetical protein